MFEALLMTIIFEIILKSITHVVNHTHTAQNQRHHQLQQHQLSFRWRSTQLTADDDKLWIKLEYNRVLHLLTEQTLSKGTWGIILLLKTCLGPRQVLSSAIHVSIEEEPTIDWDSSGSLSTAARDYMTDPDNMMMIMVNDDDDYDLLSQPTTIHPPALELLLLGLVDDYYIVAVYGQPSEQRERERENEW